MKPLTALFLLSVLVATANAASITIKLPAGMVVTKATAITEKLPTTTLDGAIDGSTITFKDPLPGSPYEAQLTLTDGTVLQGIDMGWYSRVPDKKNAEPLNDDDRQQMKAVLKKVLSFFNVDDVIILKGNHNRAVMLVQLVRDKAFHSDKGGDEVIWRPELWYFENDHGGWQKVQQTDRVVRRVRFDTHDKYHAVVDTLKWVPELGGLKSTPRNPDVEITVPANPGVPTPPIGGGPVH